MKKIVDVTLTKAQITKIVTAEASKSDKIRSLWNGGVELETMKELLGISYNFCFNVVSRYGMMGGFEDSQVEKKARGNSAEKEAIIADLKAGMSNTEVARKYRKQYNQVWGLRKELGL